MVLKAYSLIPIFVIALFFCLTPFQAHAALIGHWTFDSGDIDWDTGTVTDVSGNGNNGTVHDLTAGDETVGQVDGGLQFNGTTSYVSVPVNGSFPTSGNHARTVCLWFKPTDTSWTQDINSIFEYGTAGDSFGIDMGDFPDIQFYTWHYDLVVQMGIAGHKDDWLQICWVWNGTSSSLLYSNGVLRGSQNFGGSINTPQTSVNIGRSSLTSGYFPGVIDDVRMYDTALSGDQIDSLHEDATNPVAIQNLASTTAETTATVTWDTSTTSDSTVWYGTSSGTYTMSTSSAALVTSHSLGLTDLSSVTTYYFVVVSNDGSGDIATSSEEAFATVDLTAPIISGIAATSTASTTATITWTTIEAASTKVAYGFDISYGTNTAETDTSSSRLTSHTKGLTGLLDCTTYHYAVVSRDAALNAATSTDHLFTTIGCTASSTPISATSTSITPSGGGSANLVESGKTFTVELPANATATSSSLVIQVQAMAKTPVIDELGTPASVPNAVGSIVFNVKAIINGDTILDSFDHPVTITYAYTDADISGLDESTFWLYHYHDGAWQALDDCSVNTGTNTITCTTPNFSVFGLFGSSLPSSNTSSASGGSLPWCSGPSAPGWNASLPNGGCGANPTAPAVSGNQMFCPYYRFTRQLRYGDRGEDVRALQKFLNCAGFSLGASGPGSPGSETPNFSDRTLGSVNAYQKVYSSDILIPIETTNPTGIFAVYSQKKAYSLMLPQ